MQARHHSIAAALALSVLAGACAPTQTLISPAGLPPQRTPADLERDPVWLANCIVALEITERGELGAPVIRNGPALLARWRTALERYEPDSAARDARLTATRDRWAKSLAGRPAEERRLDIGEMISVCGAGPLDL